MCLPPAQLTRLRKHRLFIDRAATGLRAADATLVVVVQGCFVVDRDLFAGFDVSQSEEEDVIVDDLHERVGDARVIDVMRAVSAATSIQTPAIVDFTDAQHLSMRATAGFGVGDLLAGVLRNLVAFFESDGGEAALAVYRRRLDC